MDFTDKLDILYARRSSEDAKTVRVLKIRLHCSSSMQLTKGTITLRLSQMTDIQVRTLTDPAFRKPLLSFSTDVLDALS